MLWMLSTTKSPFILTDSREMILKFATPVWPCFLLLLESNVRIGRGEKNDKEDLCYRSPLTWSAGSELLKYQENFKNVITFEVNLRSKGRWLGRVPRMWPPRGPCRGGCRRMSCWAMEWTFLKICFIYFRSRELYFTIFVVLEGHWKLGLKIEVFQHFLWFENCGWKEKLYF